MLWYNFLEDRLRENHAVTRSTHAHGVCLCVIVVIVLLHHRNVETFFLDFFFHFPYYRSFILTFISPQFEHNDENVRFFRFRQMLTRLETEKRRKEETGIDREKKKKERVCKLAFFEHLHGSMDHMFSKIRKIQTNIDSKPDCLL